MRLDAHEVFAAKMSAELTVLGSWIFPSWEKIAASLDFVRRND